ncbi:hypothetical protein [Microbispora sp. CA-102843]|uniref:hypothetical protein n=1 Tax=Microbispora sp. CA-102843 TaxID=3239952 RepID=UPI003D90F2DE
MIDRVRYLWRRGEFDRALNLGRRLEELLPDPHSRILQTADSLATVLDWRRVDRELEPLPW